MIQVRDNQYDIFGNRTEVDVTVGLTTTTTRYAYDMWNPAKAGATGTAGSDIWATFTSGGSLITRQLQGDGVDQHLAYVTSSNAYWYLTDHLNSIRAVINNSGAVQDSIIYDGYGNITYQTPSPATTPLYFYTGREFDVETGLQYNRARYYDATTGRWITQDPMGFDAGDSNLYRYVNNSPSVEVDPSGEFGRRGGLFPIFPIFRPRTPLCPIPVQPCPPSQPAPPLEPTPSPIGTGRISFYPPGFTSGSGPTNGVVAGNNNPNDPAADFSKNVNTGGLNGTVQAWKNSSYTMNGTAYGGQMQIRYTSASGTLPANPTVHWLQFIKRQLYKGAAPNYQLVDGLEWRLGVSTAARKSSGLNVVLSDYIKNNAWIVDSHSSTLPFYEQAGPSQATAAYLAIFDEPGQGLNTVAGAQRLINDRVTKLFDQFKTYLVYNSKAYCVVNWSCTWTLNGAKNAFNREYAISGGEALNGVPLVPKNFPGVATSNGEFVGHKVSTAWQEWGTNILRQKVLNNRNQDSVLTFKFE